MRSGEHAQKVKQKYYLDKCRCTVDHTVGAVASQHRLHSTGILTVPHGLLFLSPDLGHIPVWHRGFVVWPSPTWSRSRWRKKGLI